MSAEELATDCHRRREAIKAAAAALVAKTPRLTPAQRDKVRPLLTLPTQREDGAA